VRLWPKRETTEERDDCAVGEWWRDRGLDDYLLTIEVRARGGGGRIVLLEQAWFSTPRDALIELVGGNAGPPYGPTLKRALDKLAGETVGPETTRVLRSDPRGWEREYAERYGPR
jgi:hypothetical protein